MSAKRREPRRRRRGQRFRPVRYLATRLADSVSTVRHAIDEPDSVALTMRDAFLRLWRTRGGGFYGLGYVIAFVVLEIQAYVANLENAATDAVGMVVQELLQFVFRFAVQSMLNGVLAFGWPIYVVDKLGGLGIAMIAVGWWSFDRYARPWIGARLPEPSRAEDAQPNAAAAPQKDPVADRGSDESAR